MKFFLISFLLAVSSLSSHAKAAKLNCADIEKRALNFQNKIPGSQSGAVVNGDGRTYIFNAPNNLCKEKSTYLLKSDKVDSYGEYQGYTLILFINLRTGKEINGWVKSYQLKKTGFGISSN